MNEEGTYSDKLKEISHENLVIIASELIDIISDQAYLSSYAIRTMLDKYLKIEGDD